jgi:MFS family permease
MKTRVLTKTRNGIANPFSNLFFLHIMNDGYLASFPLLLPFIQKDLNIQFSKIGMLTGLLNMAGVFLAIPAAYISRRFGGYKVLLMCILFYSSAFALVGISFSFFGLVLAFVIASIGFGMFHPISFAIIANTSKPANIGNRMGNYTAVGDIGRIGIAAFATVLVSLINWRNTAFVYGLFPFVIFFISFLFCKKLDLKPRWIEEKKTYIHGLHKSLLFNTVIITSFLDSFASSSLFIFLPFLFISRGSSTALLGSLSAAFFIGNMAGKVLIGKITDTFGCKKTFIASEIVMSLLLIMLASATSILWMASISILLGAVTKGTVPVINSLLAKSVPDPRLNEKAFGIISLISGIASVIAPVLYGYTAQRVGITAVFHLSALFAILSIIPIIASRFHVQALSVETRSTESWH